MEWVLRSTQLHNTFGNLGFKHGEEYYVNEKCNAALESILQNILSEDKYLRSYRRSISFGQNIEKDLIPLLLHAKDNKTIEMLVKILVNLTIPIECLLSVDVISKTDFGRRTVFEINSLLSTAKSAFSDPRVTKVLIEFLKKNVGVEQKELTEEQCTNIGNSLLLLRNILHIPEVSNNPPGYSIHEIQNQILWNIFSQSVDKILLKLIAIPEASNWGVTMVQLIALLYKDQHVGTLQKLVNMWLETSLSESSEDDESNTSPQNRDREDSSPMLTSDPSSDSSDKSNGGPNPYEWHSSSVNKMIEDNPSFEMQQQQHNMDKHISIEPSTLHDHTMKSAGNENNDPIPQYASMDRMKRQASISSSSNEDLRKLTAERPVHQKPHNAKKRFNNEARTGATNVQDDKRKKLVKRSKSNISNVQGLSHKNPTDDDISSILLDFTIDFLLKGYNPLAQTLYTQLMTNSQLEIDISLFFWLITYFSKFATQIELSFVHLCSVLSYDVISYMTAEGVGLCEQFELAAKLEGNDLRPYIRRLHLVVTAIREFVQAIEVYKKIPAEDQDALLALQVKMCKTEELRSLLVLLLRHYNPLYHTKQYLQDLVITNHILLIFLDSVMKLPGCDRSSNMSDHIKQFATPEIMYQYGLLLETYSSNGEFVNDCVFTLMHHVAGELACLGCLYQPTILKAFTSILKSEFEICDDWSDLIEYVINTYLKKQRTLQMPANIGIGSLLPSLDITQTEPEDQEEMDIELKQIIGNNTTNYSWTDEEASTLSWIYMQCSAMPDVIGEIVKIFNEDGITKSRDSVLNELYKKKLINKDDYETASKSESETNANNVQTTTEMRDDEISQLCEQLRRDGKSDFLNWIQQVLLEICHVKICLGKKSAESSSTAPMKGVDLFQEKDADTPVLSPVAYHSLVWNRSVPLVPWSCWQAAAVAEPASLQLLHVLRLLLPRDTGHVFTRVPHFWSAHYLYELAGKVAPLDPAKLKFSLSDVITSTKSSDSSAMDSSFLPGVVAPELGKDMHYQVLKRKRVAVCNFTPKPGSSFCTDSKEVYKQNWLRLVQKSQECKMALTMKSTVTAMLEDSEMPARAHSPPPATSPAAAADADALNDASYTDLFTSSHSQTEPEYNNSLSDTASVASDLTRMFVTDEDEKSDDECDRPPGVGPSTRRPRRYRQRDQRPDRSLDGYRQRDQRPDQSLDGYRQRDQRPDQSLDVYRQRDQRPDQSLDGYRQRDQRPDQSLDGYRQRDQRPDQSLDGYRQRDQRPDQSLDVYRQRDQRPDQSLDGYRQRDQRPDQSLDGYRQRDQRPDQSLDGYRQRDQRPDQSLDGYRQRDQRPDQSLDGYRQRDQRPDRSLDGYRQRDQRPDQSLDGYRQRDQRPDQSLDVYRQRDQRPDQSLDGYRQRDQRPDQSLDGYRQRDQRPDQSLDGYRQRDQRPDQSLDGYRQRDQRPDQSLDGYRQRDQRPDHSLDGYRQRDQRPDQSLDGYRQRDQRPDQSPDGYRQRDQRPDQSLDHLSAADSDNIAEKRQRVQ